MSFDISDRDDPSSAIDLEDIVPESTSNGTNVVERVDYCVEEEELEG